MPREFTLYDTLQVIPSADAGMIKAAYRYLVQEYHPDKHFGCAQACDRLVRVNHAYAVLSDPVQRSNYDRALGLPRDVHGAILVERRGRPKAAACARGPDARGTPSSRPFAFRPLV